MPKFAWEYENQMCVINIISIKTVSIYTALSVSKQYLSMYCLIFIDCAMSLMKEEQ